MLENLKKERLHKTNKKMNELVVEGLYLSTITLNVN